MKDEDFDADDKEDQSGGDSSERKFQCEKCPKSFANNYRLKRHVTNVHENCRTYQCDRCDYSTSKKQSTLPGRG